MQPESKTRNDVSSDFLDQRVRDMIEGLTEAIDHEVARRQREGLPIHVSDNGKVVDLQQTEQEAS